MAVKGSLVIHWGLFTEVIHLYTQDGLCVGKVKKHHYKPGGIAPRPHGHMAGGGLFSWVAVVTLPFPYLFSFKKALKKLGLQWFLPTSALSFLLLRVCSCPLKYVDPQKVDPP